MRKVLASKPKGESLGEKSLLSHSLVCVPPEIVAAQVILLHDDVDLIGFCRPSSLVASRHTHGSKWLQLATCYLILVPLLLME